MLHCTNRNPPGMKTSLVLMSSIALTALIATAAVSAAETKVFRCTGPSGAVEFRQTPCAPAVKEKELSIDPGRTGWVPPKPTGKTEKTRAKRHTRKLQKSEEKTEDPAQKRRCWKKRRQLEAVNRQLRRGYKAAQGGKLRRRRDDHEDYLDRFCAGG